MRSWSRQSGWWWLAIACGLALRAIFAVHHPRFDGDTLVYGDLARNMLDHHIYGLTEGMRVRSTMIRLPGYPLFLGLCFNLFGEGRYSAAVWVQIVLALAACWALARAAARSLGERVGLAVLWLACLCPFTAEYDALALTESLAMVCLVVALVALQRWQGDRKARWAVAMGAASLFAVLLRPDRGLLAMVCVLAMIVFARRRAVMPVLLVCGMVSLPLAGWAVRNWRVFRVIQPLAPKYANDPGEYVAPGFNRWYRTWAVEYWSTVNTYWMWDGGVIRLSDLPDRAMDTPAERAKTAHAYELYNRQQSATRPVDAIFAEIAAERAARHPLRTYVLMPVGRVADMWLRPRTEFFRLPLAWWRWREHPGASIVCALYAALNLSLLLLALVGLRRWPKWWREPLPLAGVMFVALRTVLLLTIDNSEQRYTVECLPVVLLLAGVALAQRKTSLPESAATFSKAD